jgi:hypothetical protein
MKLLNFPIQNSQSSEKFLKILVGIYTVCLHCKPIENGGVKQNTSVWSGALRPRTLVLGTRVLGGIDLGPASGVE